MQAYQMHRDKLRSMPSNFYTGADVKHPDHETETGKDFTPFDATKLAATEKTENEVLKVLASPLAPLDMALIQETRIRAQVHKWF